MCQEVRFKKVFISIIAFLVCTALLWPTQVSAASAPAKVGNLKVVSQNYNSLKVSWKKVKGAKGYQIYRSTSKRGKYKKVKTTKSTSWTNGKLTTGKAYYYKVRAYRGSKKGKFSSVKNGSAKVGKTTVKGSVNTTSIKLSWNKVSGASGYKLYRGSTCIKTTSARGYTDYKLKQGTKYSYKVRAYRTVKGKRYYGSYSSSRSYTTKVADSTAILNYAGKNIKLGSTFDVAQLGTPDLIVKRGIRNVYVYDSKDFSNYLELNIGTSGTWKGKVLGWYTNQSQLAVINGKPINSGMNNSQVSSVLNSSTKTASNYKGAKNFAMNHEGKLEISGQKIDGTIFCNAWKSERDIKAGEIRLRYVEKDYTADLTKEDILVESRINSLRVKQDRPIMEHDNTVYKVAKYAASDWKKSKSTEPTGTPHITSDGKTLKEREQMYGIIPGGAENSYGPIYVHEVEDNNGLASIEVIGWYNSNGHRTNMLVLYEETKFANCTQTNGVCYYANTNFVKPKNIP